MPFSLDSMTMSGFTLLTEKSVHVVLAIVNKVAGVVLKCVL
jgi:hypothetical protein